MVAGWLKLGGAALLASAPQKIWNLLSSGAVERVTLRGETDGLAGGVGRHLREVAPVLWRPHAPYVSTRAYDQRIKVFVDTPVELISETSVLHLYRGAPLLVSWYEHKHEGGGVSKGYVLSFVRGTVDVDRLLREAMQTSLAYGAGTGRFRVHERGGSGFHEMQLGQGLASPPGGTTKAVGDGSIAWAHSVRWLDGEMANFEPPKEVPVSEWMWWSPTLLQLRDDARWWMARQQWCRERGIPGRRGWMMYGSPGNGKTLMAYATAQDLDLPLYALDLSAMTSRDFVSAWKEATSDVPSVVLVEDFDSTIVGRRNVRSPEHGVGFETILNCLAGVSRASGVLFIMTTNDPDSVDPALWAPNKDGGVVEGEETRPGRIDLCVEVGLPTREGRFSVAMRVLRDEARAQKIADETDGRSVAQVQERCWRAAKNDGP